MPHDESSAGAVPTGDVPKDPPAQDPQATEKNTNEPVEDLIRDLSKVREDLSAIMAEDFKDFQGPVMIGGRVPMTQERIDRGERRKLLNGREQQLQAALREQTAATAYLG